MYQDQALGLPGYSGAAREVPSLQVGCRTMVIPGDDADRIQEHGADAQAGTAAVGPHPAASAPRVVGSEMQVLRPPHAKGRASGWSWGGSRYLLCMTIKTQQWKIHMCVIGRFISVECCQAGENEELARKDFPFSRPNQSYSGRGRKQGIIRVLIVDWKGRINLVFVICVNFPPLLICLLSSQHP